MSGSKQYHNSLLVLCKLLTPFAPHISAELWEGTDILPLHTITRISLNRFKDC